MVGRIVVFGNVNWFAVGSVVVGDKVIRTPDAGLQITMGWSSVLSPVRILQF